MKGLIKSTPEGFSVVTLPRTAGQDVMIRETKMLTFSCCGTRLLLTLRRSTEQASD